MPSAGQATKKCTIPISFKGRFPPSTAALSGLGFDSVSTSKAAVAIRKSRRGANGLPISRLEIIIRPSSMSLSFSPPAGALVELEGMRACATLLCVLSLFPSIQVGAQEMARLVLPSLSSAEKVANEPYSALAKKCRDAHDDLSSLLSKNRALLRSSEESVLSSLELERQISAIGARVKRLEAVSDDALLELVQDWLAAHRGRFDAVLFSRANNMPPARAEEGLEKLIASGEVKKVGGSLHTASAHSHGEFEQGRQGALQSLLSILKIPKHGKTGKSLPNTHI